MAVDSMISRFIEIYNEASTDELIMLLIPVIASVALIVIGIKLRIGQSRLVKVGILIICICGVIEAIWLQFDVPIVPFELNGKQLVVWLLGFVGFKLLRNARIQNSSTTLTLFKGVCLFALLFLPIAYLVGVILILAFALSST